MLGLGGILKTHQAPVGDRQIEQLRCCHRPLGNKDIGMLKSNSFINFGVHLGGLGALEISAVFVSRFWIPSWARQILSTAIAYNHHVATHINTLIQNSIFDVGSTCDHNALEAYHYFFELVDSKLI